MFKLEIERPEGSISITLKRVISDNEIFDLCKYVTNLLPTSSARVYGPVLPPQIGDVTRTDRGFVSQNRDDGNSTGVFRQTELGQYPKDSIDLGTYEEPLNGVRIKMLHILTAGRIQAVKRLREATGISIYGCKEIVYGNFPCPILTVDTAQIVLNEWKQLGIYAKIVSAD